MKKRIIKYTIVCIISITFCSQAYCFIKIPLIGSLLGSLFSSNKKHIEKIKHKESKTDVRTKVTGIEKLENKLDIMMDMMTNINMKVAGIDNSITSTIKAGRDAIQQINDTSLMKYIIAGLIFIAISLITLISTFIGLFFKYLKWKIRHSEIDKEKNNLFNEKEIYRQETKNLENYINKLEKNIVELKTKADLVKNK